MKGVFIMPKFNEQLKLLRHEADLSQQDLANIIGISKSSINMYERGDREPSIETLEAIADHFNVDMDYLLGKSNHRNKFAWLKELDSEATHEPPPKLPVNILPMPKMKRVPLIGTIACGTPILAVEDATEFVDAPESIHGDIDFALECKGDSMINARIFPGDIVYIKQQPVVANGEIAAVLIGDEATLKRVYYTPDNNCITLRACNPLYSDMIYTGPELDNIKILGKAVWFMSKVRI